MTTDLDPEIYEDQYKFFGEQKGIAQVVNIKHDPSIIHHPNFVYIGRYNRYYNLPDSKWKNIYEIGKDGTRGIVILKYEVYVLENEELIQSISELEGKIVGCWCKPKVCHGDVLVRLCEINYKMNQVKRGG